MEFKHWERWTKAIFEGSTYESHVEIRYDSKHKIWRMRYPQGLQLPFAKKEFILRHIDPKDACPINLDFGLNKKTSLAYKFPYGIDTTPSRTAAMFAKKVELKENQLDAEKALVSGLQDNLHTLNDEAKFDKKVLDNADKQSQLRSKQMFNQFFGGGGQDGGGGQ